MKVRHEFALPQDQAFYTTDRQFDVKMDPAACGTFTSDNEQFTLAASSGALGPILATCPTQHSASLETISEAAMRFYQGGGVHPFAAADYNSMLFMTRFLFGHAFAVGHTNSLEHACGQNGVFHSEARASQTEFFAYGLASHFAATLLGIPIDRFFFVTANGARADFNARVTAAELGQAGVGIGALAPGGFIVELEVKARTGWSSFRTNGQEGRALLKNLHGKVVRSQTRAFLGMIVSLPRVLGSPHGRARILIADPGEAEPLDAVQQTVLLLEQATSRLYQHGLWPTLARALAWLKELRPLHKSELLLREMTEQLDGTPQPRLMRRERDGRTFNGRIFSEVVERIGQIENRRMSHEEADDRLRVGDLGNAWYSGVDDSFVQVIEKRDDSRLRRFGVRGSDGGRDLAGRSAFHMEEEPMTEDIRAFIRSELRAALRRW